MDGYVVDFTVIELDTDKMEVLLPRDKHDRASLDVQRLLQHGFSSYKDLQSTLGFLSFCTRVIPLARLFLICHESRYVNSRIIPTRPVIV
jgi:hypothetical protein